MAAGGRAGDSDTVVPAQFRSAKFVVDGLRPAARRFRKETRNYA
jgi:hypothetical protein